MATKQAFTPAALDSLCTGKLDDPLTPGLAIEVLKSGKKRWQFRRRIPGAEVTVKLSFGLFPAHTIAAAREWAKGLNDQIEAGVDPREVKRKEELLANMTVARAHVRGRRGAVAGSGCGI